MFTRDGKLVDHDPAHPIPGGVLFDSRKEAKRFVELRALVAAGRITCLERQRRFKIKVNGIHVCTYVADFVYMERGNRIVEDVKSPMTRLLPVYVLKKKLLAAALGVQITEV